MGLMYKLRAAVGRFMFGRNGVDQLCTAMLTVEIVLYVIGTLIRIPFVQVLTRLFSMVLTVLIFYRMFSRNLTKRSIENAKFANWWVPKRAALRCFRERHTDKAHKYVKCDCGVWCRVPRGVGTVELMCPKCGEKKIVKT